MADEEEVDPRTLLASLRERNELVSEQSRELAEQALAMFAEQTARLEAGGEPTAGEVQWLVEDADDYVETCISRYDVTINGLRPMPQLLRDAPGHELAAAAADQAAIAEDLALSLRCVEAVARLRNAMIDRHRPG